MTRRALSGVVHARCREHARDAIPRASVLLLLILIILLRLLSTDIVRLFAFMLQYFVTEKCASKNQPGVCPDLPEHSGTILEAF